MGSFKEDEKKDLKSELSKIEKKISQNRKEIFKRHLKFPVLNPTFYGATIAFIAYFTFSLFLAQYVQNIVYQILIVVLLPFVIVLIALFWGDIPEENIKNGIATIEVKQKTLILKRHRKILKRVLKKPANLWGKDEQMLISFESLES